MSARGDSFFNDRSGYEGQQNDPRFPRRPQHPDFARIGEVLRSMDSAADSGGQVPGDVTFGLVDEASMRYAAEQRALMAMNAMMPGRQDPMLAAALGGMWVDAFTAGVRFQRAGGHQPG